VPDLTQLPLIESIPDPETVRSRLAQIVREQQLLRSLLRLSRQREEAAQRERAQRQGGPDRAA
jgi:hypothetical protein